MMLNYIFLSWGDIGLHKWLRTLVYTSAPTNRCGPFVRPLHWRITDPNYADWSGYHAARALCPSSNQGEIPGSWHRMSKHRRPPSLLLSKAPERGPATEVSNEFHEFSRSSRTLSGIETFFKDQMFCQQEFSQSSELCSVMIKAFLNYWHLLWLFRPPLIIYTIFDY